MTPPDPDPDEADRDPRFAGSKSVLDLLRTADALGMLPGVDIGEELGGHGGAQWTKRRDGP